MRFEFILVADWPPLAWLAQCPRGNGLISIWHGRSVERAADWFCEAVWAGPYTAGQFDRTDLVFGSGGRLRGEGAVFVSSGSTVDRLQTLETRDGAWVSNSLACLLAGVAGSVDPTYPGFVRDFKSVTRGLRRYKRTLTTSAGPVQLVYFANIRWDGQRLHDQPVGQGRGGPGAPDPHGLRPVSRLPHDVARPARGKRLGGRADARLGIAGHALLGLRLGHGGRTGAVRGLAGRHVIRSLAQRGRRYGRRDRGRPRAPRLDRIAGGVAVHAEA